MEFKWFDQEGNEITCEEYTKLRATTDTLFLYEATSTHIISTGYLGICGEHMGPFSTTVYYIDKKFAEVVRNYRTRESATKGHFHICAELAFPNEEIR
jgi:hypothetical protein